jgi:hypothetical protein
MLSKNKGKVERIVPVSNNVNKVSGREALESSNTAFANSEVIQCLFQLRCDLDFVGLKREIPVGKAAQQKIVAGR